MLLLWDEIKTPLWPYNMLLALSCVINLILIAAFLSQANPNKTTAHVPPSTPTDILYSPAQTAIKQKLQKFSLGFNPSKSPYQAPPSPELDHLWRQLYYNVSILRLPQTVAQRLPNKTVPYSNDPGFYAADLAVFHQLHCVNSIRTALARDHYEPLFPEKFDPKRGPYGAEHLSHCVNVLREAVMCASDTTVIPFWWNPEVGSVQPRTDILHTCRDFGSIWDWGWENKNVVPFDPLVHVEQ